MTDFVRTDDGRIVNDERGSGSQTRSEKLLDENYYTSNDGRSVTRTSIGYDAVESDRSEHQRHRDKKDQRSWQDLAKWNDGLWSPDRRGANREVERDRWAQTFANQLDCNSYQTARTRAIVADMDFGSYDNYTYSSEQLILGLISLVVDDDVSADDDWTIEDWIVYRDEFESLMDDLGMDRSDCWTIRKILSNDIDM